MGTIFFNLGELRTVLAYNDDVNRGKTCDCARRLCKSRGPEPLRWRTTYLSSKDKTSGTDETILGRLKY